jgi:hypothetical protein
MFFLPPLELIPDFILNEVKNLPLRSAYVGGHTNILVEVGDHLNGKDKVYLILFTLSSVLAEDNLRFFHIHQLARCFLVVSDDIFNSLGLLLVGPTKEHTIINKQEMTDLKGTVRKFYAMEHLLLLCL